MMNSSKTLLPVHLKPHDDELVSSWIVRLAAGHGLRLHTFSTLVFPGKSIWNRDIDKSVDGETLETLSTRTATPMERVCTTALRHYEGSLYKKHNMLGNTKWILPIGVYHRMRLRNGMQYCPLCLKEKAYFKKRWRLALSTVCEKHGNVLLSMCMRCRKPINFHRVHFEDGPITQCYHCGMDLTKCSSLELPAPKEDAVIQKDLYTIIEKGEVRLSDNTLVQSNHYFDVFHQLMKIVALSPFALPLQEFILPNINLNEYEPHHDVMDIDMSEWIVTPRKGKNIEHLNVYQRTYLKKMVWWLLDEWPDRFVSICKRFKILSSTIEKDVTPDNVPDWFHKVVRRKLYRYALHI